MKTTQTQSDVVELIAEGLCFPQPQQPGGKASGVQISYLELGVKRADTFNRIVPYTRKAVAVDIVDISTNLTDDPRVVFWEGTSLEYLESCEIYDFDLVFIDADHTHKASLADFRAVLPRVRNGGLILLHDTYPPSEKFTTPSWCGDTYKTALWIKNHTQELGVEIATLPFYYGVSIIRKTASDIYR